MNPTPDLTAATWRKSSYSDGGQTNCLEVTDEFPGIVPVRDSKVPDTGLLVFGRRSWAMFVEALKSNSAPRFCLHECASTVGGYCAATRKCRRGI